LDLQSKNFDVQGVDQRNYQLRLSLYTEEFFRTLPLPAWVKTIGANGELAMLAVNQTYTDTYGIESRQYVGLRDISQWTHQESKDFEEKDQAVIKTGSPLISVAVILNRKTGMNERVTIVKWPLVYQGTIIGVAGVILERITLSDKFIRTLFLLIPLKILKILLAFLKKKAGVQ
jgi:PAS domain-containing protein